MSRIRVLIIEDSLTVRKRLVEVLSSSPDLEVVGEAADGKAGIELCQRLRPAVVTLDMNLPLMSGLAATEFIMAYCPTPILIVSASTNRGELFKTYEALAAGAMDVLDKPLGTEADDEWERKLISTVRMLSRLKVITHPRARLGDLAHQLRSDPKPVGTGMRAAAIGVSTGGPAALLEIFRGLPSGFPLPIILVIHISRLFSSSFAEWLEGQCPLRASYAQDGEALPPVGEGRVLMAPPGAHLELRQGRLRLTEAPERHSCRPSVDVLFESLAQSLGPSCVASLLTGMGRDGAEGLLAVRRAGGRTIAQDEATSVVFGMPREAIMLGAAEQVLPLQEIAAAMNQIATATGPRAQ